MMMMMRLGTERNREDAISRACPELTPCLDPRRRADGIVCELCRMAAGSARPVRLAKSERVDGLPGQPTAARTYRVLRTGAIGASVVTRDGRRQITELFLPGELVMPLSDRVSAGWLEALSAVEAWEVAPLQTGNGGSGVDAARLDAFLLRAFEEQATRAQRHAALLGRLDGPERVDAFLVDLAERIGFPNGDGWRLRLPLGREEIADYLGLNAETVSRLLKRGARDGLIRFETPKQLEIPDLILLRRRVPF